jgi:hypothetical protein
MEKHVYQSEHDFMHKLEELLKSGVKPEQIDTRTPHPVLHAEELLAMPQSDVRRFVLVGGICGVATGYLFPSLTALDWTLFVGNKPLVGIPPYTVIAFELMVLFGGLSGMLGLLWTARMPGVRTIISDDVFSDQFEIYVKRD